MHKEFETKVEVAMREKESGTISFKWSNLHQTSSFS
jgi:hypothetical protein